MFWLESAHLQLENKKSVQAHVLEEQVDVKGLPVHGHRHLTADEGEAAAQLQEEVAQMGQQPGSISRSLVVAVTVRKSKL